VSFVYWLVFCATIIISETGFSYGTASQRTKKRLFTLLAAIVRGGKVSLRSIAVVHAAKESLSALFVAIAVSLAFSARSLGAATVVAAVKASAF